MLHRLVVMAFLGMVCSAAAAERIALPRPINVVVVLDATTVKGRITAWDAEGFDLADAQDAVHDVPWSKLTPERVFAIHEALLRSTDDPATAWLELGVRLKAMEGGEPHAERAFIRAERLDGSLKAKAERARKGEPLDEPAATTVSPAVEGHTDASDAGSTGLAVGPQIVGGAQRDNWGPQTPQAMEVAVARLKAFGDETRQKINRSLQLYETDFFILYTDLSAEESRRWAGELDNMYNRLTDLFAIKRGDNIWLGKCLILIFRNSDDYHRFQAVMHQTNSGTSAGMCHGFGSGEVHIAFFRQPAEMQFAHVLVHESVHGFLHRYRSPVHVPTWINEGLAEYIAFRLLPKATVVPQFQAEGRRELRIRGHTAGLFDAQQLEPWQYGVASSLTTLMIDENRKGYVAFVNGIKDGQPWRESLEKNYGVGLDKLVRVFGDTQRIDHLRP